MSDFPVRFLDYYAIASILLLIVLMLASARRTPTRSVTLFRFACLGLLLLAALQAVPNWPRFHLSAIPATRAIVTPPQLITRDSDHVEDQHQVATVSRPAPSVATPRVEAIQLSTDRSAWLRHGVNGAMWLFLATAVWMALRMIWGWRRVVRLIRRAQPAPATIQDLLSDIIGSTQARPRVVLSRDVNQPVAFGFFRMWIALPVWFRQVDDDTLRAALTHEWNHLARGDHQFRLISRWLGVLLCWNPLYWLMLREMDLAQEELADAKAAGNSPLQYIETLIRWAKGAQALPASSTMTASVRRMSPLKRRILALLEPHGRHSTAGTHCLTKTFVATTAGVLLVLTMLSFQSLPLWRSYLGTRSEDVRTVDGGLRMPDGSEIHLVGIHQRSCFGDQWWLANGDPICFTNENKDDNAPLVRELVLNLPEHVPNLLLQTNQQPAPQWTQPGATGNFAIALPNDQQTVDLRLGVPRNEWTRFASPKNELQYWPCLESDSAVITIALQAGGKPIRVVAIDQDGQRHVAEETTTARHAVTASFQQLASDAIKEIYIEQQTIDWIELQNVSLEPGHRTNVKITPVPRTSS